MDIQLASFLDQNHVLSLATIGEEGPHAASLFYARDDRYLVWVSDPASRHSRNIERDARVSATIAPDTAHFAAIRGVQLHGLARRITLDSELARLKEIFTARFEFMREADRLPENLQRAWHNMAVYLLSPESIVLIDNQRGFGHKQTWRF